MSLSPPLSILYDLTELENASRLKKEETSRTEKKIAAGKPNNPIGSQPEA